MYKVKVIDAKRIKWLKTGEVRELCNERTIAYQKEGIVEILEFLGTPNNSYQYKQNQINKYQEQIKILQTKIIKLKKQQKEIKW